MLVTQSTFEMVTESKKKNKPKKNQVYSTA